MTLWRWDGGHHIKCSPQLMQW